MKRRGLKMIKWFKIYFKLSQRLRQRNEENRILRRALETSQKKANEYYIELNWLKQRYNTLLACYENISKVIFQESKQYFVYVDNKAEETN